MKNKPFATMTIAGSDSCGGAGIQADIKTMSALGCYATSCITAITAQNTMEVTDIMATNPNTLSAQIKCVLKDFDILATKVGMIYTSENVLAIKLSLKEMNYKGYLIIDPVLIATSGSKLAKSDFLHTLTTELLPMADIITPNIYEAETICGFKINNKEDMIIAAKTIHDNFNVKSVLIKGGHLTGENMTDIYLSSKGEVTEYTLTKLDSNNTHGTGCTLSSAICSFLALGFDMHQAIEKAKYYVYCAIKEASNIDLGHGHGSLNHFFAPQKLYKNFQ